LGIWGLGISVLILGFLIIDQAYADHGEDGITKSVVAGANVVEFRDITNVLPQDATLSLDKSEYTLNENVLITLINRDENLDADSIDSATVTATTPSGFNKIVALTETAINSNEFTASMSLEGAQVGDELTIVYEPESQGVGRLSAQLTTLNGGNVVLSDRPLNDIQNILANEVFIPVSLPVRIEPTDGATLDVTNPPVIIMSYANLNLGSNDPADLSMYYDPCPIEIVINIPPFPPIIFPVDIGWTQIRDPLLADPASHNPIGKTITSDVVNTAHGQGGNLLFFFSGGFAQYPCADFILGFHTGSIGGGGGGGLVGGGVIPGLEIIKTALIIPQNTPPVVVASLEPICGDDEELFQVIFSATDAENNIVSVEAELNGIPVENGQLVEFELDDETEWEFDDNILEIEGPSLTLIVTAIDSEGESGSATANPAFFELEECDDEDDDDDDDDDDD